MTDYVVGDTIYHIFTTRAFATGIPTVLAGTPVVSAYEDDGTTQITAGITLGVDHDGVVGMNLLTIVATGANGFETGKDYNVVITTGTVSSVSVVGEAVWHFSLGRSSALMPTTAGRTLDVTAAGNAGIDWGNIENPTTTVSFTATTVNLVTSVTSVTGAVGSVTGNVSGSVASVTGAVGSVTGNVSGSVASVTGAVGSVTASVTVGTNNDKTGYSISGTINTLDGLNNFNATTDTVANVTAVVSVSGSVGSVTGAVGSVTGNVSGSVASVTGAVASVTGSVGSVTGNVSGSVASVVGAVGSVTGAVGSVTASVTVGTNNDKTGYSISGTLTTLDGLNNISTANILASGDVDGLTIEQSLKVLGAGIAGIVAGAATTSMTFKGWNASATTRITATVDANGNRSAVTVVGT